MADYADYAKLGVDALEQVSRMQEADRQGKLSAEQQQELQALLQQIPGAALEGAPERVGPSQANSPEAQAMKAQQLRALARLQQTSEEGYNDTDRAAMNDALSEANQQERGNRLAIMQRLGGNTGASIAAQLSNNQAAAQRANNQGLQVAGQSRARALQALGQYGEMAGSMRGQEMQLGSQNDAIARFNAQNSIGAGQRNADTTNEMNRFGYGAKQTGLLNKFGLNSDDSERRLKAATDSYVGKRRIATGIGGIMDKKDKEG